MALFDDPNRELDRLHAQLLSEEDEELDELLEEYGEEDYEGIFRENYEEETREPFYRNAANGYGMDIRNFANGYRGEDLFDEEEDDDRAVYYEDNSRRNKKHRRRSLRGMIVIAIFGAVAFYFGRRYGLW